MQANKISSTSFGSGTLRIYNPKDERFETLNASDIYKIKCHNTNSGTSITVADSDRIFDAPRNTHYTRTIKLAAKIPVEKVLAAYTAAMVATSNTEIDLL